MVTSRAYHTATRLADGRVLVIGGIHVDDAYGPTPTTSVEVFDPAAETWTATDPLPEPRWYHTATLLDDGRVLVAGGGAGLIDSAAEVTAYLYDPDAGTWASTGDLATPRQGHTATLLPDGRVLVAAGGGSHGSPPPSDAEIYDPVTGRWTATRDMTVPRNEHTATLLPDGTVLLVGGRADGGRQLDPEIFDPSSGRWDAIGNLVTPRDGHTATTLEDGTVLVVGGTNAGAEALAEVEWFDVRTGAWTGTGAMAEARDDHATTILADGRVLVTGGRDSGDFTVGLASAEVYDPTSGAWTPTRAMTEWRYVHTATLLDDGTVLLAGGTGSDGAVVGAERFNAGT